MFEQPQFYYETNNIFSYKILCIEKIPPKNRFETYSEYYGEINTNYLFRFPGQPGEKFYSKLKENTDEFEQPVIDKASGKIIKTIYYDHPVSKMITPKEEALVGYKVFGPHFETNCDVSDSHENRYYHIGKSYCFPSEKLSLSYGFRFYRSIDLCKNEYYSNPLSRICKVYVYGSILQLGNQFLTDYMDIGEEIIDPFKKKVEKRTKVVAKNNTRRK